MKKSKKIVAFMTAISAVACIFPATINNAYAVEGDGYTWVVEPTIQALDVNPIYEKSSNKANFGYFIESPYSLVELEFASSPLSDYILIDYDGNHSFMKYDPDGIEYNGITQEKKFTQYRSEENNHIRFWWANSDGETYFFCTKTGGFFKDSADMRYKCNFCGSDFKGTSTHGWFAYHDEEKNLLYGFSYDPFNASGTNAIPDEGSNKVEGDYFNTVGSATINETDKKVSFNGSYGILKNGEMLVGFDEGYDCALTYKYGVTALRKGGKWYYFDEDGNQMTNIPACDGALATEGEYNQEGCFFTYENTVPYLPSEGYIAVNNENGGGYYDIDGNNIIPIGEFEAVRPVYDGKAWVKSGDLWGVIQLAGSENISTTTATNQSGNSTTTTTALSGIAGNSGTTVSGSGTNPENTTDNGNDNSGNNSSGNNNSSSGSSGKESPKTGVAGAGLAMTGIAVAVGMAFISRKKNN